MAQPAAGADGQRHPRAVSRDGRAGEGVHPRRRHLPGRALAALRAASSACRRSPLYRALRRLNPSPFLFFLDLGDYALVGSSPEILVRLRDGTVTVRPIAGTRRRGADKAEDEALAAGPDGRSQGAGRAPHAARPRPQRCRPRGRDRHRARHREDEGRVLLATSCTSSRTSRAASARTATRWTR